MTHPDPECQTVLELTKEWTDCVASKNTRRVEELLTEDFIYSQHPTLGGVQMSKAQIIAFMPSIENSQTTLVEQHARRFGDVIVVHNLTQANQKVSEQEASKADAGKSFLGRTLVDSSAWRKEGGSWRCYDYRLIDTI